MVSEGKVAGGMIPKVNCCVRSLAQGVRTASIIDGRLPHSLLLEILTDEGAGTMITGELSNETVTEPPFVELGLESYSRAEIEDGKYEIRSPLMESLRLGENLGYLICNRYRFYFSVPVICSTGV
ncbi:uncharacterized protein A4U43_C10F8150 [Asparagus officinalis]|uniref:Aspartate/glutamate/uridylate kinase domain-containing protein n=1 Tax=Asparagus officinalis TaxID=4686 RepID=A0A5P1E1C4_ASPOF|nr:uncharacterized protein A4U43_C10F8150 [Asparagus officinalis]